eukprot:m51a1_g316 hypothetical protein (592) ;mRNA; f:418152-420626
MRSSSLAVALATLACLLALAHSSGPPVFELLVRSGDGAREVLWRTGDAFPTHNSTLDAIVAAVGAADAALQGWFSLTWRPPLTVYVGERGAAGTEAAGVWVGSRTASRTVLWRGYAQRQWLFLDQSPRLATNAVLGNAFADIFALALDALANPNATQQRSPGQSAPGDAGIRDAWAPSCLDMRGDAAQGTAAATPFPSTAAQMTVPPYTNQTFFSLLNSMVITHTFAILADGDAQSGVAGIGIDAAYPLFWGAAQAYMNNDRATFLELSDALRQSCAQRIGMALADHEGNRTVLVTAGTCEAVERALRATGMALPLPARMAPSYMFRANSAAIARMPLLCGANATDSIAFATYFGDHQWSAVTVRQGASALAWNCTTAEHRTVFDSRQTVDVVAHVCPVPPEVGRGVAAGAAEVRVALAGGSSAAAEAVFLPRPAVSGVSYAGTDALGLPVLSIAGAFYTDFESLPGREHVVVRVCSGGDCWADAVLTRFPRADELLVPVAHRGSLSVYVSQHGGLYWTGPFEVRVPEGDGDGGRGRVWRKLLPYAGLGVLGVLVLCAVAYKVATAGADAWRARRRRAWPSAATERQPILA